MNVRSIDLLEGSVMDEEMDLIRRLRLGEPAALHGIYQRYKDDLLTVACCLTGERAAGEDVLHDVFVAIAAGARRLWVRESLRAYLMTSVVNRARDHLRRNRRSPRLLEAPPELPDVSGDPSRGLLANERNERLYLALAELPYEQREVITLHLHGEMTFKEIAVEQGVSTNTVQSRYRYGLDKLRSSLGVEANT